MEPCQVPVFCKRNPGPGLAVREPHCCLSMVCLPGIGCGLGRRETSHFVPRAAAATAGGAASCEPRSPAGSTRLSHCVSKLGSTASFVHIPPSPEPIFPELEEAFPWTLGITEPVGVHIGPSLWPGGYQLGDEGSGAQGAQRDGGWQSSSASAFLTR